MRQLEKFEAQLLPAAVAAGHGETRDHAWAWLRGLLRDALRAALLGAPAAAALGDALAAHPALSEQCDALFLAAQPLPHTRRLATAALSVAGVGAEARAPNPNPNPNLNPSPSPNPNLNPNPNPNRTP